VAALITGLRPDRVRANLERVREVIAATGRPLDEVEILAAVKYLQSESLGVLAEAGLSLLGENRAQELLAKSETYGDRFTWDFIGHLQSRKVPMLIPRVRYIHSVASDSALEQLRRHGTERTQVLVEVNFSGEPGKSGIAPAELPGVLERCPVTAVGLMTMPPLIADAEDSRPHFAALR